MIEGKKDSFESRVEESLNRPIVNLPSIEPGRYVKYKNDTYIVTKTNTNGTIQIYNPLLEGVVAKISVSKDNLIMLSNKANIVNYRDSEYIVTDKNNITVYSCSVKAAADYKMVGILKRIQLLFNKMMLYIRTKVF